MAIIFNTTVSNKLALHCKCWIEPLVLLIQFNISYKAPETNFWALIFRRIWLYNTVWWGCIRTMMMTIVLISLVLCGFAILILILSSFYQFITICHTLFVITLTLLYSYQYYMSFNLHIIQKSIRKKLITNTSHVNI